MNRGRADGTHLVENDAHAAGGRLPRCLRAGEPTTDDVDHWVVVRLKANTTTLCAGGLASAGSRCRALYGAPFESSTARPRRGIFARRQQFGGLLVGNRLGIHRLRQRRVEAAVGDVRTIAAGQQLDRQPVLRQLFQHRLCRLTAARLLRRANQRQRRVERDGEDVVVRFERSEFVTVLHVRAEAAEVGDDRLVVVGVHAEGARQREQLERLLQRDRRFGHAALQRGALRFLNRLTALLLRRRLWCFAELNVCAIASVHHVDVLTGGRIDAKRARPLGLGAHQLHRLLDAQVRRRNVVRQRRGPSRSALADLHERTETPDAHADGFLALRIDAEIEQRVVGLLRALLRRRQQPAVLLRAEIELPQELDPFALTARDLVEVLFHFGGEVCFDEVAEVVAQQLRHRERREARDERLALAEDISAADDRRDRRRVGGRPADAEPLQLLDERRFREACRRRRLVALRLDAEERDRIVGTGTLERVPDVIGGISGRVNLIANLALRQDRLLLLELRRGIIAAFDVGTAETCKLDRLAAGRQHRGLAVRRLR